MENKKVKAEDIFSGPSDFQGFGTGGGNCGVVPELAEGRIPRWHDSAFTGTDVREGPVNEEDLCPHF